MESMGMLKAVVRGGRAVLVDDRVDYPEGTQLDVDIHEPVDELDDRELAALDLELEAGRRAYEKTGKAYTADEVIARLRAHR